MGAGIRLKWAIIAQSAANLLTVIPHHAFHPMPYPTAAGKSLTVIPYRAFRPMPCPSAAANLLTVIPHRAFRPMPYPSTAAKSLTVIRALFPVIPALCPVIPAKAGIQTIAVKPVTRNQVRIPTSGSPLPL